MQIALWLFLSLFIAFGDEGVGIDPNGGVTTLSDDGSGLDPHGGRVTALRDEGSGIDPNGGSFIDPNG